MSSGDDRKALEAMRKKLDAMMQAEELHEINDRRKVLIAPSEAVQLEEQVQERAQLASELALARARRKVEGTRDDRSTVVVRQHTSEVLALLKEISELEQVDLPPTQSGADVVAAQRGTQIQSRAASSSPPKGVGIERGPKKRAQTLSRQATELEAARSAARAADEYEKKFKQMRDELREEVLEEVFGCVVRTTSQTVQAAQIDILAEVDYSLPCYEALSTDMPLGALLEQFRCRPIWDDLCLRTSPIVYRNPSTSAGHDDRDRERQRQRTKAKKQMNDPAPIDYDAVDEGPLPKAVIPDVVLPPRAPIARDELLQRTLEELELLSEDCEKTEAGLRSKKESFRLLSEGVDARHEQLKSANAELRTSSDKNALQQPILLQNRLPLFEAPTFFAAGNSEGPTPMPKSEPSPTHPATLIPVDVLRSRAKRNIIQIAHLRSLVEK